MTTKLDAIRQREQAATEGPWSVSVWEGGYLTVDFDTKDGISVIPMDEANTAFIAASRADVPLLLAGVEAAHDAQKGLGSLLWVANNLHNHKTDTFREFMESALEDWRRGYDQLAAALAPLLEPEG